MFRFFVPSSLSGRSLRTAALVAAQAISLGLGAAGATAWRNDAGPSWLHQIFAAQETGTQTQSALCTDQNGNLSVADVAALANPAVVTVTNLQTGLPGSSDAEPVGAGSGFIIDEQGHVVTNAHVIQDADELSVEFEDGTTVPASVVGEDDPGLLDVAVLQLDLSGGQTVPGVITWGDSTTVRPGDRVVAIGSALAEFSNTVSDGTVNAIGRSLEGYGLGSLIQHDAEIWHGNSGGPLLNLHGEVIGINSAGLSNTDSPVDVAPARIAFAIASNPVRQVVEQLIANGSVARPFLGITGRAVEGGQQIEEVQPDTPAAAAGLEAGDVITAINGQAIDERTSLIERLLEHQPGDTVTLTVDRDGQEQSVDVTLATRPPASD